MPVGWGAIPFRDLFAEFIQTYDGMLICELRGRYFEQTRESAENLGAVLHELGVGRHLAELLVN
jgi:hypothetical protein